MHGNGGPTRSVAGNRFRKSNCDYASTVRRHSCHALTTVVFAPSNAAKDGAAEQIGGGQNLNALLVITFISNFDHRKNTARSNAIKSAHPGQPVKENTIDVGTKLIQNGRASTPKKHA
jgi:hypothetical protein